MSVNHIVGILLEFAGVKVELLREYRFLQQVASEQSQFLSCLPVLSSGFFELVFPP